LCKFKASYSSFHKSLESSYSTDFLPNEENLGDETQFEKELKKHLAAFDTTTPDENKNWHPRLKNFIEDQVKKEVITINGRFVHTYNKRTYLQIMKHQTLHYLIKIQMN
jgi:predicted SprT family Zn-dependent metalloprotease